ncbi:pyrroline-5-carboxylate reductase [Thermosulfidibacter takaii ABI70S6]|uniref:Pyrroline-5-carboxylate reductase n=1 Tax=Thermosulfidibacter takaii (strain DSM 17441 / JCM 13301 / NBRC 103674 / ABI70S6) TaxID=1298851 RepID=A0A0S3QVZ1_THET7|nr:NAD(P)-binding domain-containing protein [Thermosulfidibacter takaii]BAT72485.1 pyrroline-5-carboxylate reductase [Thermosulfidibacter takaii ABI70S6]
MQRIGFIGAGRATRIILGGIKRRLGSLPEVYVTDKSSEALLGIKRLYEEVKILDNPKEVAERAELLFLSVPYTVLEDAIRDVRDALNRDTTVIYPGPKYTLEDISKMLDGHKKIVRMIPNAPSIINKGYNPVVFSPTFSKTEKERILNFLSLLGKCVETQEKLLEAYVVTTAMSPTYFWFQFIELKNIAVKLGIPEEDAKKAIRETIKGAVDLLFNEHFSEEEVLDLVPAKPFAKDEETIKQLFHKNISRVYNKIKPTH